MNTFDDERLSADACYALLRVDDLASLLRAAANRRDLAHGHVVSYSRKVFIPLTRLCRDVCHYCTFAQSPHRLEKPFMSPDEGSSRRARRPGGRLSRSALYPRRQTGASLQRRESRTRRVGISARRWPISRRWQNWCLTRPDCCRISIRACCNPRTSHGCGRYRVSQGIMLESASERLHATRRRAFRKSRQSPALRLATIEAAGEHKVPFTSGILIGIGETRRERIEALLALRDLHDRHGHLQEIIIQNFRPKPATRMQDSIAPSIEDHIWTIAVARLIFDSDMNIQAPPNLSPGSLTQLIDAGINDWGGVSPVTPDWVNPEAPWPHLLEA